MPENERKEKRARFPKSLHKGTFRPFRYFGVADKPNIIPRSRKSAGSAKVRLAERDSITAAAMDGELKV
jgi:hypothetical protein